MKNIAFTIYSGIAFFTFLFILIYSGSDRIVNMIGTGGYWGYVVAIFFWGFAFALSFLFSLADLLQEKKRRKRQ